MNQITKDSFNPIVLQLEMPHISILPLFEIIADDSIFINDALELFFDYIDDNQSYSCFFWTKADSDEVRLVKKLVNDIHKKTLTKPIEIIEKLSANLKPYNYSLSALINKLNSKLGISIKHEHSLTLDISL